ncbi:DUF4192 domain-containing protein [Jonesia quinghaiensis]|uniref:DUF4192 domain-containing protein n=1 Tax=Jonesia quinghaiensis TaxID=262806 RepID=UPI00146A45C2|nr:DUF4192 domain-containing protein [Jonesia quinghaiensis]
MTQTMRVSQPSDLISLIPYQLGYAPTRSLVVVSLSGEPHTVGVIARCDLLDVDDPNTVTAIVRACQRDEARKIFPVVYLDPDRGSTSFDLHDEDRIDVLRAFSSLGQSAGHLVNKHDLWIVASDGAVAWCEVIRCNETHCTLGPHGSQRYASHEDMKSSRISAAMVVAGRSYVARREDLLATQETDQLHRLDMDERVVEWEDRWALASDCVSRTALRHAAVQSVTALLAQRHAHDAPHRECISPQECSARDGSWVLAGQNSELWATIGAAIDDTCVRDGLLVAMTPLGVEALAAYAQADECGDDLCMGGSDCVVWPARDKMACEALQFIMHAPTATAPQHCGFTDMMDLLRQGVTFIPERHHAPFHTLLALGYWWQGDGARASLHLDKAHQCDATYRLALLLQTVLRAGLAPAWARRQSDRDESEIS